MDLWGPEPWSDLAGRPWSHWDLWFAAVAVSDYGGSLDEREAQLVGELRGHTGRWGPEAKLSHLADRTDDSHGNVGQLRVPAGHAELIEGFLSSLAAECRSHHLDHQAEEALQQLAWLAVEVFRAADRPGFHQRHLRQRCLALTGVDIDDEGHDPRPTLRVVESPGGHP